MLREWLFGGAHGWLLLCRRRQLSLSPSGAWDGCGAPKVPQGTWACEKPHPRTAPLTRFIVHMQESRAFAFQCHVCGDCSRLVFPYPSVHRCVSLLGKLVPRRRVGQITNLKTHTHLERVAQHTVRSTARFSTTPSPSSPAASHARDQSDARPGTTVVILCWMLSWVRLQIAPIRRSRLHKACGH